jgi:hypothetical protein
VKLSKEQIRRSLYESAAEGLLKHDETPEGETTWKLTDAGKSRAQQILDEAMDQYGENADRFLSESLDIPLHMAREMLAYRGAERAESKEATS